MPEDWDSGDEIETMKRPMNKDFGIEEGEEYTDTAFPALKPDVDIFWPHGGWFCLRGRHRVVIPDHARYSSIHDLPKISSPAGIPVELHDNILARLDLSDAPGGGINHVALSKRELGTVALVARRWADVCQRILFTQPYFESFYFMAKVMIKLIKVRC